MNLIIVESPTKANTFNKFLSKEYQVTATMGHVRDLSEKKLALDLTESFKPEYIINKKRSETVVTIKSLAKKASSIILATDADREGEAISYHIAYILGFIKENWPNSLVKKNNKLKRIVFHEITKSALSEALLHAQELNLNLVNAQQARRILDRIVGYKLSPLLWKKMGKRWLSAGRVQTVALRFIVEREAEIKKFAKEPFYKIFAVFKNSCELKAYLISKNNEKYEKNFTLNLFDGNYTYSKTTIDKNNNEIIKKDLQADTYKINDIVENQNKRYPAPAFTTSSMQQEAVRTLGLSSKITMKLAQNLYERGLITYHRTDSVNLSVKFLNEAQKFIKKEYGNDYTLFSPRIYKTKSKLAQEAHEAIRPTDLKITNIDNLDLTHSHKKLYSLIFRKAIASQMKEAVINTIKIKILSAKGYLFESGWEEILFDGFLKIYSPAKLKQEAAAQAKTKPKLGEAVSLKNLEIKETETTPPPRYNEASLIKTLEERGIGRPSTFAPIISTLQERNYVEKKDNRFQPTFLGDAVCNYLSSAFSDIFKISFTAQMEEKLDLIAHGEKEIISVLDNFYNPFLKHLTKEEKNKRFIDVEEPTDQICSQCGKQLVFRYSKYGKFYACSGYPACKFTKPYYDSIAKPCPRCSGKIIIKYTKTKKKFYGCSNYPNCTFAAWRLNQIN